MRPNSGRSKFERIAPKAAISQVDPTHFGLRSCTTVDTVNLDQLEQVNVPLLSSERRSAYSPRMESSTSPTYRILWIWIAFAWSCIAIAWGPAAALAASPDPSFRAFASAIVLCFATFLPWALTTPTLFAVCRRYPLGEGNNARSIAALLLIGIGLVPSLAGFLPLIEGLGAVALPAVFGEPQAPSEALRRVLVTSLFALPTYVAVIAIGQTLVWANRARNQEVRSARAELRALRAELSPHFLMNALGSIAQMAHVSAERAEAALLALADVLRSGLSAEEEMHTLADELGAVDEHVTLYRELHGKLVYRREVGDGLWQQQVPTRILVPLIENALTHGAPLPDGTRQIELTVTDIFGALQIHISNPILRDSRASRGLGTGLDQVRQRLAILYGDKGCLTAAPNGDQFAVILEVPHG